MPLEDLNGVILVNSSGFQGSASLCIVEEHETAFVSVQTQSRGVHQPRQRPAHHHFAHLGGARCAGTRSTCIERGELEGKTVGVVAQDTPGQSEAVKTGLVDVLRRPTASTWPHSM